ncbi:MAG: phosphatase PAP2 family protein, partial [Steroidobacteraceae bacterium]
VLLWFAWRRNWRGAAHAAGAVGLSSLLTLFIKAELHVPRPHALYSGWGAFAFPGGHSAANAALYGFLAMVAAWELPSRWKLLVTSIAALWVAAIAFSRVYLGAHWLSDVLAGIAFGTAWAAFLAIAYLRRSPPPVGGGGLCALAGATLLAVGGVHVARSNATDMRRYAVREGTQVMPWIEWWRSGWSRLPARQLDLTGQVGAPLTFQWAGGRAALVGDLAARGWRAPDPWTARSALAWLTSHVSLASLPVLPRLQNGRQEVLVRVLPFTGQSGDSRLVLRLWRSNVKIKGPGAATVSLLIGTVEEQHIERPIWFLATTRNMADYDRGLGVLATAIPMSHLVRRPPAVRGPGWHGGVLLGWAAVFAAERSPVSTCKHTTIVVTCAYDRDRSQSMSDFRLPSEELEYAVLTERSHLGTASVRALR